MRRTIRIATRVAIATVAAVLAPAWLPAAEAQSSAGTAAPQTAGRDRQLNRALTVPTIPLANLEQYIVELRQEVFTRKVEILGKAMSFTPDQAGAFWPIYSAYTAELKEISSIRQKAASDFATEFASMDDAKADALAQRLMRFTTRRAALLQRYYGVVKDHLGAKVATRFLQVESRLIALHDLQLAAQVPLLQ